MCKRLVFALLFYFNYFAYTVLFTLCTDVDDLVVVVVLFLAPGCYLTVGVAVGGVRCAGLLLLFIVDSKSQLKYKAQRP